MGYSDTDRRGPRRLKPPWNDSGPGERCLSSLVTSAEEPKANRPLPTCELTGAGMGLGGG